MSRSRWKNVFVNSILLYTVLNSSGDGVIFVVNSRESTIVDEFVGKSFSVHNGRQYFVLSVVNNMLGHKFGEFVHTKKICVYRKTKKVGKKYIKK